MRHPAPRSSHGFLAASLATFACVSCIGPDTLSPETAADSWIDSTACSAPHLTPAELEEIATQILAGLPPESDPPAKVLEATCVPGQSPSFEIPDGPVVEIPEEDTWVFVVQGFHAPGPSWPAVFAPRYGVRNPRGSGIDLGRLATGKGPGEPPGAPNPLPPATGAYGYYLVSDETGRPSGYGFFGPPATIPPVNE